MKRLLLFLILVAAALPMACADPSVPAAYMELSAATASPEPAPGPTPTPIPEPTPLHTPNAAPTPDPTPTQTETPTPAEARILLVGDLMCLGGQQRSARQGDGFHFTPSFSQVQELFLGADYVIGNLETAVSQSTRLTYQLGETALPVLNAPSEYLDALRSAGVTAVSTVNNHCLDAGALGIEETAAALEERGIAYVGTCAQTEGKRYILADVNGIRIAVLAYSEFFNQKDRTLTKEQRDYMVHVYSSERMAEDVRLAREAGAEFVIAYTHWGVENDAVPTGSQRRRAQEFADAGVDVVAGAHPHRLQAAEYISAADGKEMLCLFSLGNFLSSMVERYHKDTAVIELRLVKEDGSVRLERAGYHPYEVGRWEGHSCVVLPADEAARERIAGTLGDIVVALT